MAAAMFTVGGCAQETVAAEKVSAEPGKILIAYYSYSGNTKFAAEVIQKTTGGTLFEIVWRRRKKKSAPDLSLNSKPMRRILPNMK